MPSETYAAYLQMVLSAQLPPAAWGWLEQQLATLRPGRSFYLAFSRAPRFIKGELALTDDQLAEAAHLCPGFNPARWTAVQAARTLLLLQVPYENPDEYQSVVDQLFATADLGELAALYAALPLLPCPETHVKRAAEGVRTAMTRVFDAVALDNPYPHRYLPAEAWNQMVLKAVFNARPLHRIFGLDERRNPALARMLVDYAHERWAAGRPLTPEVWRLVGPYLTARQLPDIQRLLRSADALENQAGALALAESDLPVANALLKEQGAAGQNVNSKSVTWQSIGERAYAV